jgi:ornithine cyclodeaminase/alanine dehydrogenase-like protein (mu-crystallin family)
MLYLCEEDVRRLLPMREAIRLVREAFVEWSRGAAQNQPRRRLILPSGSVLHSMAGASGRYFGTKIYSTHAKHGAHFFFILFDSETARPLAWFEANYLGQIRTGAATGVATDLLVSPDAKILAVIGSGFQARSQVEAVLSVRAIEQVRIWSRNAERREAFAVECADAFQVPVTGARSSQECVAGAEVVVTATNSATPVLEASSVSLGALVNAVGSNAPKRRELPQDLISIASLIVADSIEQARIEAGDLLLALDEAGWKRVRELRDFPARPDQGITIFKSVGLGLEDVAVAAWVYERATELGVGRRTLYS